VTGGLLEREEELDRIGRALARARAGSGVVVVVEGQPGIGKTALVAGARAAATRDGMRVLRARGAELEREFAFGVARQLFESALHAAPDPAALAQGQAGLAARLLGFPGAPPADAEPAPDPLFAILHGLYWLTANLAAEAPLCLVVDDAHWSDTNSLRFLNFLRTRVEELPVGVLLAVRPAEPGAAVEQLEALAADPAVVLVRPAPLGPEAAAEILEAGLGARPEPGFVAACEAATGGLPFLLHELTAGLREEGVAPVAARAGRVHALGVGRVGPWVRARLARLPDDAVALAHAVAVLEEGETPVAAVLAALEPAAAAAAAEVLTAAGLLRAGRPLAFVHPMVRAAILDAIPAAARARAHRRAAELLAGDPAAAGRIAEHLLATDPAGDPWVVERLTAAAAEAAAAGAPESAAVLLRRVLAEPPPPERRAELLLALGGAEANAGDAEAIEHLQAALAAAEGDEQRAGAALVLGDALFRLNRLAEAIDVLDGAAVGLDPGPAAVALDILVAGIAAHDAALAPIHAGRLAATRARADADPDAPPELLAVAAFLAAERNEPAARCAELGLRALGRLAGRRPGARDAIWVNQVAITLLWSERWAELDALLESTVAQARASGDAGLLAGSLAYRSWMSLRRGRLAAAEADARLALETADLPAPMLLRLVNAGALVETLVERGDHDGAEAVLAAHAGEVDREHGPNAYLKYGRARLRLAQGRLDAALADALAVGDVAGRIGIVCPSVLPWRAEAAQAHLLLGDEAAARRLVRDEVELARAFGAPRALGVALRAAGVADGDARALREAIGALDRAGAALEAARARTELGALVRRGNQRAQARELLTVALAQAERLGGVLVAQRAEVELAATGARARRAGPSGRDVLTASERRVAELAAEGRTNRDIAQLLFVTAKTVEGHLHQVYRKLDVTGREALPNALR
jgi:DNA-binding CsgD family transcriptional regulator